MSGGFKGILGGVAAAGFAAICGAAGAEGTAVCETPQVAVYFLHGEASPTEGAAAILAMAGEAATRCDAAVVGVTARFDPARDGDLGLALKRLAAVADRLAGMGVPLDRIQVLARPADADNPAQGPGRIDIRVAGPETGARPKEHSTDRTPSSEA